MDANECDRGRTSGIGCSCVVLLVPTRIEQSDSRMHAPTWQPQIFVGGPFKLQSTQCERSYDYTHILSLLCARIACQQSSEVGGAKMKTG